MRIAGIKLGHDGAIAYIDNGKLIFSHEQEKNSHLRYSSLKFDGILSAFEAIPAPPDVVAVGGWSDLHGEIKHREIGAGYLGADAKQAAQTKMFGIPVRQFSGSHERDHLFCSYGLSPFEEGQPCYALIWEGAIGRFYFIDSDFNIHSYPEVLVGPGQRYSYLYYLADRESKGGPLQGGWESRPGKLMALAGCADGTSLAEADDAFVSKFLDPGIRDPRLMKSNKAALPFECPILNIGVESLRFKNIAQVFSDRLFSLFYEFARKNLKKGYPLLIGGGCGLNCEWNTNWKNSGIFSDIFVPPCTNDSGSAIGAAIDAQHHFTRKAKIEWTVYAGPDFVDDMHEGNDSWEELPYDAYEIATALKCGDVVAWARGRCEIGPRALGNRSLLASPFEHTMTARLNGIKYREHYRPVAPACLAEDVHLHFDWCGESPYMLHFQKVTNPLLKAITHTDGSARVQTVTEKQNPEFHELLRAFKEVAGVGVLCNTSLNFKGRGFINRTSDMLRFATERQIERVVAGKRSFRRRRNTPEMQYFR